MFMCKKHIDIEGLRSVQNDMNGTLRSVQSDMDGNTTFSSK